MGLERIPPAQRCYARNAFSKNLYKMVMLLRVTIHGIVFGEVKHGKRLISQSRLFR